MQNLKYLIAFSQKIFVIILLGMLFSCQKESSSLKNDETNGIKIYTALLSIKNIESRKLAYSSLSGQERFEFWQTRLSKAILNGQFDRTQSNKIKELATALTIDYFTISDKKAIFKASYLPQWISSCKGILNDFEIFDLIFNMNYETPFLILLKNKKSGLVTNVENTPPGCICAVSSSWTCFFLSYPSGLPSWGDCTIAAACKQTSSGCGAFNDDECDGSKCNSTPVEI